MCVLQFNRAINRDLTLANTASHGRILSYTGGVRPVIGDAVYRMKRSGLKHNVAMATVPAMDGTAIAGELGDFDPVKVDLISGSDLEPLWDQLVRDHHYLGYQNLLGHRLKYLAFIGDRPVAALSWSAPALKLAARDCFIGWSAEQRRRHLEQVACNSRFLVMPWVRIPNMASRVLALNIARLPLDWQRSFGHRLMLVETFVDRRFYKGTCYMASNWVRIGQSQGSTKQGKGYRYHGNRREIYLYVIDPDFRKIIGCQQRPAPLPDRPPQTIAKVEELSMLLEHCQWHSKISADLDLDQNDVKTMAQELVEFHSSFHDCFGRVEHQRLGLAYISGLMSNADSKSAEPIALEFLDRKSVRSVQKFMNVGGACCIFWFFFF
jgi:hypothetical protein